MPKKDQTPHLSPLSILPSEPGPRRQKIKVTPVITPIDGNISTLKWPEDSDIVSTSIFHQCNCSARRVSSAATSKIPASKVTVKMSSPAALTISPPSVLKLLRFSKKTRGSRGSWNANSEFKTPTLARIENKVYKEIPPQLADIQPAAIDLDICTDPPSLEEVTAAVKTMKSRKAPGADGITAEMLKADINVTAPKLTEIFRQIWESGQVPVAWKTGLIFKLPKKGDLGDCNNWRGITLLSLTSKVFSKIILSRLTATLEKDLRPQQAGFHPGRSCSEHIFILRQILEQSNEWNTPLYINFIDLEKAFDSIHRESLWKILRHYGVPAKLVQVIAMLYSDFKSQVVCDTELTDPFNVSTGVKQGCILSPFLFILAMDWIMKTSTDNERRGIRWTMTMTATTALEDLDFADDIALLSHRHQDMQGRREPARAPGQTISPGPCNL
ncbi:hypothetical protein C0Q70_17336 [Pomacea canaliculata]|uniref:Reverse transcriptase domain-containing protein n=1 Tax=Pomacea canaliculata TaxID=400727 RepID=A0A2T7NK49_POMCA|nr:hypothetical protein C0Q70_17336 [Pomacea canaliculata]